MSKPDIPKFLELLDDVLVEEDKNHTSSDTIRYNPSSASCVKEDGTVGGACLRGLWYKAKKEPETNPKALTTRLQGGFGDAIHTWLLAKWAKSNRIKISAEDAARAKIETLDNEVSYRLDGLVNYRGDEGGLEIKTKQSYAVQRMYKEGGPGDSDILQVVSYFGVNPALKWFSLVLFGRDTAYRLEYHLWKDQETGDIFIEQVLPAGKAKVIRDYTWKGIISRWKTLENHIKDNTVPHRDFQAVLDKEGKVTQKRTKNYVEYTTAYQCRYCRWQDKCWGEPDAKEFAVKLP